MKKTLFITVVLLASITSIAQKTKAKNKAAETSAQAVKQEIEEDLKPVEAEKGKEVVAIYPFTCSGRTYYDYALNAGNAVEGGFVRSKRFTVVERNRFKIVNEEELFKEANTNDIVNKARKLGAKYVVTGNVMSATDGTQGSKNILTGGVNFKYIAQLQMNF